MYTVGAFTIFKYSHTQDQELTLTTFTSLSIANMIANEPPGMLRLGDRGDGTAAGKETARQRYAHINAGHVPDIIRFGVKPLCSTLRSIRAAQMLHPLSRLPRPRPRLDR